MATPCKDMHVAQIASPLTHGNRALRVGDYAVAINYYLSALLATPALGKIIVGNLEMARRKYRAMRGASESLNVAVCGKELPHNAAGRVYELAKLYETFAEVEIIGNIFPSYGNEVWESIRNAAIPYHTFIVEDESRFIDYAIKLVAAHPYDIVHLSKPRATNIFFGILYKLIWDAKVIVDIDDEELAYVGAETPISIDDYLKTHGKLLEMRDLDKKDWTCIAVDLAKEFDGVTVSNIALQKRYGGEIIRHVRDERLYQPSFEHKCNSREQYGIPLDKKVVLFFGAPHEHKVILEIADAIAALKRKDILFAIVGDFPDPSLKIMLGQKKEIEYAFIGNQSFDSILDVIAIADCCVLLQDLESFVSEFQVPAELSDAFGMCVPVLATITLSLSDVFTTGALMPINVHELSQQIAIALDDSIVSKQMVLAGQQFFLRELSIVVNAPRLQALIDNDATAQTLSPALKKLGQASGGIARLLPLDFCPVLSKSNTDHLCSSNASAPNGGVKRFDAEWYTQQNTDVGMKVGRAYAHHMNYGKNEGRQNHSDEEAVRLILERNDQCQFNIENSNHLDIPISRSNGLKQTLVALGYKPALSIDMFKCVNRNKLKSGKYAFPLISIVVPTYNTPEQFLVEMIESVFAQTYTNWELCIVDDASTKEHVVRILNHYVMLDSRVKVIFNDRHRNISAATNQALLFVKGEYITFVDHDDLLEPEALSICIKYIQTISADVIYTDHDTISQDGKVVHSFHKPAWSPEYLRHIMYVGHLLVVRKTLIDKVGGMDSTFDGVQDFELMLRLGELEIRIEHVAKVLYHWRVKDANGAASVNAKENTTDLQVRAVQAHLNRIGELGVAFKHPNIPHCCKVAVNANKSKKVSIIIPFKDQSNFIGPCLNSIYKKSTYENFEVIVVGNGAKDIHALRLLNAYPIRQIEYDGTFNYSKANNLGAQAAHGEIFIFLNDATSVITPDWIENLVYYINFIDVGTVGPLLVYENGTAQHAGVELGARGIDDHLMQKLPADLDGNAGSLSCPREVSAVTAACLAISKENYQACNGFSELYETDYQDMDLCLRLRDMGYRNIFTPDARLSYFERVSGEKKYDVLDRLLLQDTWRLMLASADPYFSSGFLLESFNIH